MAHSRAVVDVDGEAVPVLVRRLTVAQAERVYGLGYPRGTAEDPDDVFVARVALIDRYVRPARGAVVYDDAPLEQGFASVYSSRVDVIGALYMALVTAQAPTDQERAALEVAARFSGWVAEAQQRQSDSHWARTGTSCGACHREQLCGKRACNGTPAQKTVWHDVKLAVKVCPVLSFTKEVERALRAFFWTHDYQVGVSAASWAQVRLIEAGGVSAQEAWLTSACSVLRSVHNAMAREAQKEAAS